MPLLQSAAPAGGAGGAGSRADSFTSSTPVRFVAAAIAGTALAATGQHLLVQAVPAASDGAAALRAGIDGLLGTAPEQSAPTTPDVSAAPVVAASAAAPLVTEPVGAIGAEPLTAEPVVADAAGLVKAADLQRVAAEESARAAEQERARVAEQERAAADRAADSEAAAAAAVAGGGVQMVDGTFTSSFGARNGRAHEGIDVAAPIGTPIHVPLDGTVIDSGPASGFGLWVRVQHEDGTITTYGHINRSFVGVGEEVEAGEVIAEVGNRGQSTGPHLHFEVTTEAGTKINPRPWMNEFGVTL
ncbi:M23 family metallopeptidase [Pseudonocardia lacus]|uniref:M23 family metallopeptidase n=1 Tax=Pseudonocardia lacus TaxID=2835865 RepID=UPI0020296C8E|nr:M23 family metallopeptidase [Pseudonocardia lacus]